MRKLLSVLLLFVLASASAFAQKGIVSGTVKDAATGEEIIGANVVIRGTTTGAATDPFGEFKFFANPGVYDVEVRFIGYKTQILKDVTVKEDAATVLEVKLEEDVEALDEVVVVAKADRGSERILILDRKASDIVLEKIGVQELSKVGAGDAAQGLKKVVGLSVQGSRFVVVRGLGDRYNVGQLNGFPVASPNPDNRVLPFDIFPTDVIKNLSVAKSFSPDQYADFTGASINLATKDYPDDPVLSINFGMGFNTQSTGDAFLFDSQQSEDFLGFNSTRETPAIVGGGPAAGEGFFTSSNAETYTEDNFFNTSFDPVVEDAPVNSSMGISYGNLFELGGERKLGVFLSANHSRDFVYSFGRLAQLRAVGGYRNNFNFDRYAYNTATSGLANVTYIINERNSVTLNTLYTHLSSNDVLQTNGFYFDRDPLDVWTRRITYKDYGLLATQISGNHELSPKIKLEWGFSRSAATANEPDRRQLTFTYNRGELDLEQYRFNNIDRADNHRFFSELDDTDNAGRIGATFITRENEDDPDNPFTAIKAGVQVRDKTREFFIRRFLYVPTTPQFFDQFPTIDPSNIDGVVNLQNLNNGNYSVVESTNPSDDYDASLFILAPYAEYQKQLVPNKLKMNLGLRVEVSEQVTNFNLQTDSDLLPRRDQTLSSTDFFPSLSLRYNVTDNNILRFSASRTISRPDFKEVANFQYQPFFGSITVVGNEALENGYNYNFDLRYEKYTEDGGLLAATLFSKVLNNPLTTVIQAGAVFLQSWQNADNGSVQGIELESRRSLGFLGPRFEDFSLNANVSFLLSNIDIAEGGSLSNTSNSRGLVGASPYLINADLSYNKEKESLGYNFTLAFNTFGRRLFGLGVQGAGDIFERPVNTLNLSTRLDLGEARQWSLKASANNLLNPNIVIEQELLNADGSVDEVLELNAFQQGVTFSIGVGYNFLAR